MSKSLRTASPASWGSLPWIFERSVIPPQARPPKLITRLFGRRKPTLFHRCLAVHLISASHPGALQ
jgi:hypothetical protein